VELTCVCCGFTQEFADGEAAFQAGWDAPPHFTGYVACNLCPAAFIVLGKTQELHAEIHEKWAREGRPDHFSQETCIRPQDRIG
jgi:hypothetical protein